MPSPLNWFARVPPGYCPYAPPIRASFDEIHRTRFTPTGSAYALTRLPDSALELAIKEIAATQRWQSQAGVSLFPSADLIDKCVHTDCLDTITGNDIRTVFPSCLITLPIASALPVPGTSDRVEHLLTTIYDDGEPLTAILDGNVSEPCGLRMPPGSRHLLIVVYRTSSHCHVISLGLNDRTISECIHFTQNHYISDTPSPQDREETLTISNWVCPVVINLLLVAQSFPTYLQPMPMHYHAPRNYRNNPQPPAFHLSRVRSFLPSPILPPRPVSGDGTHASPVMHTRRGHWRRQPHTPAWLATQDPPPAEVPLPDGRKAHMVWIEPTLVLPAQ